VGFHYYQIIIDGVSVSVPNNKPVFGMGKWDSGIEIPEKDVNYFIPHIESSYRVLTDPDNRAKEHIATRYILLNS